MIKQLVFLSLIFISFSLHGGKIFVTASPEDLKGLSVYILDKNYYPHLKFPQQEEELLAECYPQHNFQVKDSLYDNMVGNYHYNGSCLIPFIREFNEPKYCIVLNDLEFDETQNFVSVPLYIYRFDGVAWVAKYGIRWRLINLEEKDKIGVSLFVDDYGNLRITAEGLNENDFSYFEVEKNIEDFYYRSS